MKRLAVTLLMALVPLLMVSCGSDSSSSNSPQPDSPSAMTSVSMSAVDKGVDAASGSVSTVSGKSGIIALMKSLKKAPVVEPVDVWSKDGTVHMTGTQTDSDLQVTLEFFDFKTTVEDEGVEYAVTLKGKISYEYILTATGFDFKYNGTFTMTIGDTTYDVAWNIVMSLNTTTYESSIVGTITYGGVEYSINEDGTSEEGVSKKD